MNTIEPRKYINLMTLFIFDERIFYSIIDNSILIYLKHNFISFIYDNDILNLNFKCI